MTRKRQKSPDIPVHKRRVVCEEGPDPVDKHVGAVIRRQRMFKGLTQSDLGKALGLTFQQVQKYESGMNRVGASNLLRIADALDVDVAYFFRGLGNGGSSGGQDTPIGAGSPDHDALAGSLESRDVLRLASYYAKIEDPDVRRSILSLVKELSVLGDQGDLEQSRR